MADDLQFQDITHTHTVIDINKEQPKTFTSFSRNAADESDVDDATTDSEGLLNKEKAPKPSPGFWTFEYYQQFFDVDTDDVLARIVGSMIPNPRRNFLQGYIRQNPDLYGPFWICTTLIITIAIAGNVANYIQTEGDYKWSSDFRKVTFSAATIYSYWWLAPTMLWLALLWRGNKAGVTFLELLCVYGYSLFIYIPISVLWVIQVSWLQWTLVIAGLVMSGSVLVFTFWPLLRDDSKQVSMAIALLVVLLHSLLAIGFMLYFFHVPSTTGDHAHNSISTTRLPALHDHAPIKHS